MISPSFSTVLFSFCVLKEVFAVDPFVVFFFVFVFPGCVFWFVSSCWTVEGMVDSDVSPPCHGILFHISLRGQPPLAVIFLGVRQGRYHDVRMVFPPWQGRPAIRPTMGDSDFMIDLPPCAVRLVVYFGFFPSLYLIRGEIGQ